MMVVVDNDGNSDNNNNNNNNKLSQGDHTNTTTSVCARDNTKSVACLIIALLRICAASAVEPVFLLRPTPIYSVTVREERG